MLPKKKSLLLGTIIIAFFLIASTTFAGTVTRSFSTSSAGLFENITVMLNVDLDETDTFYIIDEIYPSNFVLKDAGSGSTDHEGHLKWVVITGAEDTFYEYDLTAPSSGNGNFFGEYAFDSSTGDILGEDVIIHNNSVFIEDEQASLRVTPHTAISPVNDFKQEFTVCNKTEIETTIYAGYVFDNALQAGKVTYWQEPIYEWLEHEITCDYDFNFVIGEDTDQNPNRAWCFETLIDLNGTDPDINVLHWEKEFHTGNISTATIQYDVNELVSGKSWLDVTTSFTENHQVINDKHIYPFTSGLVFPASTCKTWVIEYKPDPNTINKKWDLWLWANDSGWNCILTDTCQKTLKLDPWWDAGANWMYKQKITAHTSDILSGDVTGDHVLLVDVNASNTDFWANVKADGSDVRFINANEDGEYDFHFEKWVNDTNMIAWVEVTDTFPSASDLEFYLYYGYGSATDGQDEEGTYPASYDAVWHLEDNSTPQDDSTSNGYDLIHVNTPTLEATGKIGYAVQYVQDSSERSYNGALGDDLATKFTIATWVMKEAGWDTDSIGYEYITAKVSQSGTSQFEIRWTQEGNSGIGTYSEGSNSGLGAKFTGKEDFTDGQWYHIVFVFDSVADTLKFYVDTDLTDGFDESGSIGTWEQGTFADWQINAQNADNYADQYLDEYKVFWGTALTADEVNLIYASENIGLLEFGTEEVGITDSCSCPASGNWEITSGDNCSLATECSLTTGNLHIVEGQLTITSIGTLNIPSTYHVFIQQDNNLHIEKGGKLSITK